MFKQLCIKSKYISSEDNIVKDFYNPILKKAIRYDRVSAYFSASALSTYSEGLEYFAKQGNKYRLIISKDISEEDYLLIKKGYELKDKIRNELLNALNIQLTLKQEKSISNLAYLIALGIVEVKFAFKKQGIFHDKCGLFYDNNENVICFSGSENETFSGITRNYESFQVVCSWLDINGFYASSITKSEREFENLWTNNHKDIVVVSADKVILNRILQFNKGRMVMEEILLKPNSAILDFDGQLLLRLNISSIDKFINSSIFKLYIKPYIESITEQTIFFRSDISYIDFLKIGERIGTRIKKLDIDYFETKRLKEYIQNKNIYIDKRAKIGISIRQNDPQVKTQFDKYSQIVNSMMERKLRDIQMRDSFFMYAMEKSCNFSVPGSGKTSAALGVFAFLFTNRIVKRIVVISPKNAFGSWIDEFATCFEKKIELNIFNCQTNTPIKQKIKALKYESSSKNLFLFNYESLANYETILSSLVQTKTLLIFDEVHKIKAINGKYASHALNIAKNAGYTIAMTGTPIPNSYLDIYNLLHILFSEEYNDFFGFDTRMLSVPSENEKDIINKKLQPFFCRTTKQQLSVPLPNDDMSIICNATENEKRLFDIVSSRYKKNKFALFIRILQAESNPLLLNNALSEDDFSNMFDDIGQIDDINEIDFSDEIKTLINEIGLTTKKKKCIELIQTLVGQGKTVILWCIFTDSIHSFQNLLRKNGIKAKVVNGEIPLEERQNIIKSFKNKEFSVLITNPHTLAESVSLHQVCHDAIYFEYSYNLVHLLQSKDRIHRLGLPENQYTQWYFLKEFYDAPDTSFSLDENIYNRLKDKETTMINAIENCKLEEVTTTQEDLDIIFRRLI